MPSGRGLPAGAAATSIVPRVAGLIVLALALAAGPAWAAPKVGEAVYARGAATASRNGEVLVVGRGTPILEGDVLTTGERSFLLVNFSDGTKLTLRPDTVFQVEQYAHGAGEENALLRLFKGGLRAVTGLVSSRNSEGFRVRTSIATIGIRGTDFTARLCGDDCLREASRYAQPAGAPPPAVVGRVAFVRGPLVARAPSGPERSLVTGASFYEGDLLETGAQTVAVLVFRDDGRVTLQPGTRFRIDRYAYDEKSPSTGTTFLSLLRGGLRAVTGLLGRAAPSNYRVSTPVATIGIRGTSFDLICQDECARPGSAQAAPDGVLERALAGLLALVPEVQAAVPVGPGLYILPRNPLIVTPIGGQPVNLAAGQNAFFPGNLGPHVLGPQIPAQILNLLGVVPRPETVPLPPGLFDAAAMPEPPPGQLQLVVSVQDEGHATVAGRDIGKGEALVVGGEQQVTRLEGGAPGFVRQDPYNAIDPARLPVRDPGQAPLECRV